VLFSGLHGSALPSRETSHSRIAPIDFIDQDPITMIPRFLVAALCVLGPLTCVAHGGNINGEARYISFSVPGALGTYPMSINASMTVTGYYFVTPNVARGFLRDADGTITTFNVAGGVWTEPEGINAAGNITGFYQPVLQDGVGGPVQGFLRYADGHIITIDAPLANYDVGAQPVSISDFDDIAGTYIAQSPSVFTRSAGVLTTIRAPDGGSTVATAINASGSVVGYSGYTGFVAHPDGYWAEIAIPAFPGCAQQTIPDGINAAGMVAGWFSNYTFNNNGTCNAVRTGGFVMSPDGELTLFQPPGTIPTLPSHLQEYDGVAFPHWISIDQAGDVTGSYWDAAGVQHGFVRNPYGTITSFDPPEGKQTTATSISDGGAIAGFYQYNAGGGPPVGFIRVPW
jgi:hypothetical protein